MGANDGLCGMTSGNGRQEDPIRLSMFSVVLEGGGTAPLLDNPLIRCQAGEQLVLAYVLRTALMDYFHLPADMRVTLQQWNLVVDRNLEAFQRIIEGKFERDEWEMQESYPRMLITLEDMQKSDEEFRAQMSDFRSSE
jgi:hypothetical protein